VTDFKDIRVERLDHGVARIIFARAEQNNTSRPEGLAELCVAMDELSVDAQVRAIILAADGKHFSAGADFGFLDSLTKMSPGAIKAQVYEHFQGAARRIWHCPKPTIALVQGAAVTVGCELALACDFRVAADKAFFQESWIKLGIMPPLGGLFLLPRLVGLGRAMDMCARGLPMDADAALANGLVSEVVPREDLERRGLEIAGELAALSPRAYSVIKQSMHRALASDMEAEWSANLPNQALLLSGEDFIEGLTAIKGKRAPQFKDA
jgi:enoyl-CoA hydratase/carnithine racemase